MKVPLYKKIEQVHFAPINKDGDIDEWTFGENFVISKDTHPELYNQMEKDYDHLTERMRTLVNSGQYISASDVNQGKTVKLLEIRPKGARWWCKQKHLEWCRYYKTRRKICLFLLLQTIRYEVHLQQPIDN